jgi:hypothetical protein
MTATRSRIGQGAALEIWARLAEEGKAPSELTFAGQVLPTYSVGIDPWVGRLTSTYMKILSRTDAHFKLVIAPYGGGKTHFLMAVGSKALIEDFAVAYIGCTQGVDFENTIELYKAFMKSLQLPGEERPGASRMLSRVIKHKMEQIRNAGAPDPEEAFESWLKKVARDDYPENAFGRVMAEALIGEYEPSSAVAGDAALRWLRGELDTLTKDEMTALRLAKVPNRARNELGRNLLLSMFCFIRETGVNGTVVLFDEVETMFTAKGKALQRVLSAMRVMLDVPGTVPGGVPVLGLFSAVPDVLEQLPKYKALEQRMAVKGASFEEGNDYATQLHLDRLQSQEELLQLIGFKLIELGELATGHRFDRSIQEKNVACLAEVAAERNLEVDARRLFVKTCTNILDLQVQQGEQEFSEEELSDRYRGYFDGVKKSEQSESEP